MPLTAAIHERVRPFLAPVSVEAPAGSSPRSDPRYERCLAEVGKLDALHGGLPDWKIVVEQGGDVLRSTAKDLLIAAHVAHGLGVLEGLGGLAVGASLLAEIIDQFWDGLFPELKRLRGRANTVAWFVERAARSLDGAELAAADRPALDALQAGLERLRAVVDARFGVDAPPLRPLLGAVERLAASLPPEAIVEPADVAPAPTLVAADAAARPPSPPSATVTPPAPTSTNTAVGVTLPSPPATGADPTAVLREFGASLAGAAAQLRRADPRLAAPYRVLRTALWLPFADGPRTTGGKSPVPAPPAALRLQLDKLMANARWPDLLEEVESALVQHRFWLDLHRLAAQALGALGPDHGPARAALVGELAALLRRIPAIVELTFNDGSPVADAQTRAWLDREVLAAPPGVATPTTESAGPDDEAEAAAEAGALLAQGDLHGAVARLHARVQAAPPGRPRFRLRLLLARTLVDAGQAEVARAVYAALDEEVRRHDLEHWDLALATRCVASHLSCVRVLVKAGRASGQEAGVLYDRLCRLDPVLGLKSGT